MHHRPARGERPRVGEQGFGRVTFRAPLLPSRRRTSELPASLMHWTGFAVIVAAHEIEQRYERCLRPLGISVRDFAVLAEVKQRPGIGQLALAERVGVGRSRLSDQLTVLETIGLTERLLNEADLRRRRVWLTREGHAVLAEAREAIDRMDRGWTGRLSMTERPRFRAMLDRLQPHTGGPPRGFPPMS